MGKVISFGVSKPFNAKNQNLTGFDGYIRIAATAVNTALVAADLDLSKINIKISLVRRGQTIAIATDNLQNLTIASNYFSPISRTAQASWLNGGTRILVAAAAAAKEVRVCPIKFDFGSIINLDGDDRLMMEFNLASSAISTAVDTASSYANIDFTAGIGIEYVTPQYRSIGVEASCTSFTETLGDNVTRVVLVNTNKTDILDASAVISNLTFSSDKYSYTADYAKLLEMQNQAFVDETISGYRLQNFCLFNGEVDADNVKLDASTISTNVTASKNFICVFSFLSDAMTLSKAIQMQNKQDKHNFRKVSV